MLATVMTHRARFAVVSTIALAAVVSTGVSCSRKASSGLTAAGSTSIQPFAEQWAEEYRKTNPKVDIHVQGGGSTAGVQAALTGAAQIGMCSRELKPEEASQVKRIVVATDALAVIVHPGQTAADLTVEQVQKIFTGEIKNWKDVGGADAAIHVVTREEGSGARGAFEELVMHKVKIASSALVQDSQGAVRQMVSTDPVAIGYISSGQVDTSVKALYLAGVPPTEENIASKKYPLMRPFLFVTKGEPTPEAKAFIDWIKGPDGQALGRKMGLYPAQE
jgi:phosphate transport system substrate-binding protein